MRSTENQNNLTNFISTPPFAQTTIWPFRAENRPKTPFGNWSMVGCVKTACIGIKKLVTSFCSSYRLNTVQRPFWTQFTEIPAASGKFTFHRKNSKITCVLKTFAAPSSRTLKRPNGSMPVLGRTRNQRSLWNPNISFVVYLVGRGLLRCVK